jgi:restriction system protein
MSGHRRRRRSRRSRPLGESLATVGLGLIFLVLLGGAGSAILGSLANPLVLVPLGACAGGAVYLAVRFRLRQRLRRHLRHRTLLELLGLTPARFEAAIADLLRDVGYRGVRHVGGRGDLAADIVCHDQQGRSVVVQCKRYAPGQRIGSPEIQKFIGMVTVHHRADYGMFVTTTRFTEPAKQLAKQHGVVLYDDERLTALLAQTYGENGHVRTSNLPAVQPALPGTPFGQA